MIAKDNIPISKFVKSKDLRKGIELRTRDSLPSSAIAITHLIKSFYEKVKESQIVKLKNNEHISISMDEWSSKSRRYLNVNAHISDNESICLGLSPIVGSATSENIYQTLLNKLNDFDIDVTKIVASTNDGASVMTKIGKTSPFYMHLCIAHGMHLGIFSKFFLIVLAVMKTFFEVGVNESPTNSDSEDDEEMFQIDSKNAPSTNFTCDYLLEKIRKIFRKLKKSPLKNDYLQKYVIEKHGKNLEAVLDVKTRWNSTVAMVERFLMINNCIKESGLFDENFSDCDLIFLNVLYFTIIYISL